MNRKVVENVGESEIVFNLLLNYGIFYLEDVMSVGSQQPFRGCVDDGLEAVADQEDVLEVLKIPVNEKQIVRDLFGAMRQEEQRGIFSNVFPFLVYCQNFVTKLLNRF